MRKDDADALQKEWDKCRDFLVKFDDHIHDLRHYGTGFITALLAAEAILLPSATGKGAIAVVKMTVIVITLVLIFTLRLTERNYELFQQASSVRAEAIERLLGLDLTGGISETFSMDRMGILVNVQYALLALGTGALGYAILQPILWPIRIQSESAAIVIIATLLAILMIMGIRHIVPLKERAYWSFDRRTLYRGESLRVTLTNISKRRVKLKPDIPWCITCPNGDSIAPPGNKAQVLESGESYDWFWKPVQEPTKASPGAYGFSFPENKKAFETDLPLIHFPIRISEKIDAFSDQIDAFLRPNRFCPTDGSDNIVWLRQTMNGEKLETRKCPSCFVDLPRRFNFCPTCGLKVRELWDQAEK